MKNINIHLGLHKTGSTFLQKVIFPAHKEQCGYLDLRTESPAFLEYVLYENDFCFDPTTAYKKLRIKQIHNTQLTISDEQFAGFPRDNGRDRKRYFDRLNMIFPNAKYFIVFRNQESIVASLYLQYVKTGGSASLYEYLTYNRHPLEFALKNYIFYGPYVQYILKKVGKNRLLCLYYEDLINNPISFLSSIAQYLGFELRDDIDKFIVIKKNKSLNPMLVNIARYVNKICSSRKQPFQLLPKIVGTIIYRILLKISSDKRSKRYIDSPFIKKFCVEPKSMNHVLSEFSQRELSDLGY